MKTHLAVTLALLMLPLAVPPAKAMDPPAPENVVAYVTEEDVVVSWTPVVVPGSTVRYNVYGFDGHHAVLLAEDLGTWELAAHVEAGYLTYGVSAVVDGDEGAIVVACLIIIQLRPPFIRFINC